MKGAIIDRIIAMLLSQITPARVFRIVRRILESVQTYTEDTENEIDDTLVDILIEVFTIEETDGEPNGE